MAIYSTNNKPNSLNENYSYTHDDIGLILYEAEMNSMRIFEATLQADFAQIVGIREGTLLESEAEAADAANKVGLMEAIKKALEKFWQKIKEVYDNAIGLFKRYIMKDGKEIVKDFDKVWDAAKSNKEGYRLFDDTIENAIYEYVLNKKSKLNITTTAVSKIINDFMNKNKFRDGMYDASIHDDDIKAQIYTYLCDKEINNKDEFIDYIKAACLNSGTTITSSNVDKVVKIMRDQLTGTIVKDLEKTRDDCLDVIKSYQDRILKDEGNGNIGYMNMLTNAMEYAITNLCSTEISCARTALANSRKYLGAIKTYMSHAPKAKDANNNKAAEETVEEVIEDEIAKEVAKIEEAVMLADAEIYTALVY